MKFSLLSSSRYSERRVVSCVKAKDMSVVMDLVLWGVKLTKCQVKLGYYLTVKTIIFH